VTTSTRFSTAILDRSFFARPARTVACQLIGCYLQRDDVVLRITETEAYTGPDDTACHARSGKTERNASMFALPGSTYVYLCYGIHHLLNISTDAEGIGAAVLIRAAEPVSGLDTILQRRGQRSGAALLAGPGKVGQALDLDTSWCFHDATTAGGLVARAANDEVSVVSGPRVGIDYADEADVRAALRFADATSEYVTRRSELTPFK
jgi:DNA-3-methyladenine glycosylase